MSESARDDWVQCPSGEFLRLGERLQHQRSRRVALRAAGVLTVVILLVGAGVFLQTTANRDYHFAGIACRDVLRMAKAFAADELTPEARDQILQHVAQCPKCGPRYKEMGLVEGERPAVLSGRQQLARHDAAELLTRPRAIPQT